MAFSEAKKVPFLLILFTTLLAQLPPPPAMFAKEKKLQLV